MFVESVFLLYNNAIKRLAENRKEGEDKDRVIMQILTRAISSTGKMNREKNCEVCL